MDGVSACPEGMSCVRPRSSADPEGFGRCVAALGSFGEGCGSFVPFDGGEAILCEAGLFCARRPTDSDESPGCERAEDWAKLVGLAPLGSPGAPPGVCFPPVREGQRCDSNLATVSAQRPRGCRPCEDGTACLTYAEAGIDGPDDERRCFRRCEQPSGAADNGRCACRTSTCTTAPTEALDPVSEQSLGRHFCTPCTPSGEEYDESMPCCDVEVSTPPPTVERDFPHEDEATLCCRPAEAECVPDFEPELCCPGTTCDPATRRCRPCGRRTDDDVANLACCPGYARRTNPPGLGGQAFCEPCSAHGLRCGEDRLDAVSSTGAFDSIVLPEPAPRWWRGTNGAGGELVQAYMDVDSSHFRIGPNHRAYLLDGMLRDGSSTFALQLAQSPPGEFRTIEPDRPDLRSARVHDIGTCSALLPWELLANVVGLVFNQQLDSMSNSNPLILREDPFTVRPVMQSWPLHTMVPLGPWSGREALEVEARYRSTSTAGCNDVEINITGTFGMQAVPGVVVTPATREEDLRIAEVGCVVNDDEPSLYQCLLPTLVEDRIELDEYSFLRGAGDDLEEWDRAYTETVRCWPRRHEYRCLLPRPRLGPVAPPEAFQTVDLPRPILSLVRSVDWSLERRDLDISIPGCIFEVIKGAIMNDLESQVDEALTRASNIVNFIINQVWGGRFTEDFGLAPRQLRECRPLEGTTRPDDWPCQWSYFRGGRRHQCMDLGATYGYRCDGAHLEVRRMLVRPEGVELVLADGPSDPQAELLRNRVGGAPGLPDRDIVIENDEGEVLLSLAGQSALCDPNRGVVGVPDPTIETALRSLEPRGVFPALFDIDAEICRRDDPACDGICEFGISCGLVGRLLDEVDEELDREEISRLLLALGLGPANPSFSICVSGRCCGRIGRACCPDGCAEGAICTEDNVCRACGGLNRPCCADDACEEGTCIGGRCEDS